MKVLPWIGPGGLTGLYQPREESSGPGASITGCEQPVLPSQRQGSDGVLNCISAGPKKSPPHTSPGRAQASINRFLNVLFINWQYSELHVDSSVFCSF
jgi:hypothetical protein